MASEWPRATLKEAGVTLIDCVHKTPKAQDEGFPYIGIPQLKDGRVAFDANPRLISEEDLILWSVKAKPQTNDVILSRRCNPGETAHVADETPFALGQNLVLLRSSGCELYPPFLRWVTRSPQWWWEVEKYLNVGAVFDSLRCADIPSFKIPLPPLPGQKAIAHILGSLDDKIELNRRMNETLEGMAQALFKSWFVDFDPVIDNILAKNMAKYPSPNLSQGERDAARNEDAGSSPSGRSGDEGAIFDGIPEEFLARAETRRKALADGTANREVAKAFPDSFIETDEMGWIPEGWEVGRISELCDAVQSGGTPKRSVPEYWDGNIKWLSSGEVREVIALSTKETITQLGVDKSAAKVWPRHTTVIAMYGATAGQVCFLATEMTANQACCALIPTSSSRSFVFMASRRSSGSLLEQATGSAQQNLNKSLVANNPSVIPSEEILSSYESSAFPLIDKWIAKL